MTGNEEYSLLCLPPGKKSLPLVLISYLVLQTVCCSGTELQHRSLVQVPPGVSPSAGYASLGPQSQGPGPAVDALMDLWGTNLAPFTVSMQQELLRVLNETVQDAEEDELQLLAVDELLPLSGPSSVSVNNIKPTRLSAPIASPSPSGGMRRLLAGSLRKLLQVLAQAGSSAEIANLVHIQVKVRISNPPGQAALIQQETINAVNGPVLSMLQQGGLNVTFLQLTGLSLVYEGGSMGDGQPSPKPDRLSKADIGLIAAAAAIVALLMVAGFVFLWRRRLARARMNQPQQEKGTPTGSTTSLQARSNLSPSGSMNGRHMAANISPPTSHSNSLISCRTSVAAEQDVEKLPGGVDFDTSLWSVPFSELQFSRVIGEGSFGRVFLGKWRETTVAIKILNAPGGPLPDDSWDLQDLTQLRDVSWSQVHQGQTTAQRLLVEELRKEATLMAGLRHPNIVMFLGVSLDPPCMVTEFCARGSLLDVLHRARTNEAVAIELDWRRRLRLALDAAKGMFYLHSRQPPVLHRDLKSANLLVDKHWQAKVADFNLSRVMQPSAAVSSLAATNPRWLPPEVLSGNGCNSSADVYAFGIILWELLTWQVPWENDTPWQVVISVVDHDRRPEIPAEEHLPGGLPAAQKEYLGLMQSCWATDPCKRPVYEAIIASMRALIDAEDAHTANRQQPQAMTELPSSNAPTVPSQQQTSCGS